MDRRKFIARAGKTGLALATLPNIIGNFSVQALARVDGPLQQLLDATDRILVLIQLPGGNDGLNTVIPYTNPIYYANRPSIAIAAKDTLKLTDTMGLHPALSGFRDLYNDGSMAIVQGVTYPNPDRSHFRGTDIWLTATDANVFAGTGWVGRYLETLAPDFPTTLPANPLAIQIGTSLSLGLLGNKGPMGVSFRDPDEFYRLVNSGVTEEVPSSNQGNTPAGNEVAFMRTIARSADVYAKVVKAAADKGTNTVTYPQTDLASKLKIVSQLISGGLSTRIYLVSYTGNTFDTHADQGGASGQHARLLQQLGDAVSMFMQDMRKQGLADKVAGMTFSEFGRRVAENGSEGTDHGTAAPLFVFGNDVRGGQLVGKDPNLTELDERGDLLMENDFHNVYSSVLLQWFATQTSTAQHALFKDFSGSALPLFKSAPVSVRDASQTAPTVAVSPNPATSVATVTFDAVHASSVAIEVHDMRGRLMFAQSAHASDGRATIDVSALPPSTYVLTLRADRAVVNSILTVTR